MEELYREIAQKLAAQQQPRQEYSPALDPVTPAESRQWLTFQDGQAPYQVGNWQNQFMSDLQGAFVPAVEDSPEQVIYKTIAAGLNLFGGRAAMKSAGGDLSMAPGVLGANVWHGSPYKFDAFDASKIGTGEGAQAYGHGLYFADTPGTAKWYADSVSQRVDYPQGAIEKLPPSLSGSEVRELGFLGQKMQKAGNLPEAEMVRWRELYAKADKYNRAVDEYRPKPNLYKVDLPDEMIGRMLDWDKPLSQQPGIKAALNNKYGDWEIFARQLGLDDTKATGKDLYYAFSGMRDRLGGIEMGGREVQASNRIKSLGIPGIRYLDQGSRTAGKGTYNYVVFPGEEKALKILERK